MLLSKLLERLLFEGRIVLSGPVRADGGDEREAVAILMRAFDAHRLTVAGRPLDFERDTALAAARFVVNAAWGLVSEAETDSELVQHLRLPPPATPSQHLSGDLLLRHLPQIHRRASRLHPSDALTERLAETLRSWPLSGVLADLPDGPLTPLDCGGHAGLLLLYAERLADNFKPAWVPQGAGRDYVELVWHEMGKDVALLEAVSSEPRP
jgi:MoxR-vWA-beta-propeller ternary system domain bpX4